MTSQRVNTQQHSPACRGSESGCRTCQFHRRSEPSRLPRGSAIGASSLNLRNYFFWDFWKAGSRSFFWGSSGLERNAQSKTKSIWKQRRFPGIRVLHHPDVLQGPTCYQKVSLIAWIWGRNPRPAKTSTVPSGTGCLLTRLCIWINHFQDFETSSSAQWRNSEGKLPIFPSKRLERFFHEKFFKQVENLLVPGHRFDGGGDGHQDTLIEVPTITGDWRCFTGNPCSINWFVTKGNTLSSN